MSFVQKALRSLSPRTLWLGVIAVVVVLGLVFAAVSTQRVAAEDTRGQDSTATVESDEPLGSAGGMQDPVPSHATAARTDATATRLEIPRIAVDSTLEQLALDPVTGVLDPPVEWLSAGWYRDGTVPGDTGPAVIAGHVDSVTAPAVFARLGELVAGDEIRATLSNGEVERFVVDSITSAPKNAFPTEQVYGPTPTPQLRIITCDGAFDRSTGHYLDNLVVFATLVP